MKRLISVLITVLLLFQILCLFACEKDDNATDIENTITSNTETDKTTEEEETTMSPEEEIFIHRHDNLPEEYREHILVKAKEAGACKNLTGDVLVTLIFIDDSVSSWTAEEITKFSNEIEKELTNLSDAATSYGAEVNFRTLTKQAKTATEIIELGDSSKWEEEAVNKAGLSSLKTANKETASEYGADSSPIIFLLNKEKRSYAHSSHSSKSEAEYALVYESDSLRHELLHLYGAKDFYYPETVLNSAKKHFPDSIMLDSTKNVDSLTAYLVGWTKSPSQSALDFLNDTKDVTDDDVSKALEDEKFTGKTTKEMATGTYSGELMEGVINGYGKMNFTNGDVYEGNWKNGKKHGYGKLTWASGDVYEGNWNEDSQNGKGKYCWSNGDVYDGDWVDGERIGYGKFMWASGDVYEGNFNNADLNGYGIYTWPSGNKYEGNFVNGSRHGEGSFYWADGSYYTGNWQNGVRTGKGTMTWADGTTYTGDWLDEMKTGKGTMTWPDGATYIGEWKEDKMSGQGKYTDADGNAFEGSYEDGKFVG